MYSRQSSQVRFPPGRLPYLSLALLFGTIAVGLIAFVPLAHSSPNDYTITIDTDDDEYGTGTGCALREAIQAANTGSSFGGCTIAGTSGDTIIVLPAGIYTLTRTGGGEDSNATGDLDITATHRIIINGAGQATTIIDAGGDDLLGDRALDIVTSTATVELHDLTITGGRAPFGNPGSSGGGISNAGSLTLTNVTVRGNEAGTGGSPMGAKGGDGGGIYNGGALELNNCLIEDNFAGSGGFGDGGGRGGSGGGIYNGGTVTLKNSTVHNNTTGGGQESASAGNGGGIYNNGTAILEGSTLYLNDGGHGGDDGGRSGDGGGIYNTSVMTITNSTISSNGAGWGYEGCGCGTGGGIYNASSGDLDLNNVTIAGNESGKDASWNYCDGGGLINEGNVNFQNTIIAYNRGSPSDDCVADTGSELVSGGYNLIGDYDDFFCHVIGDTTTNITNTDPKLTGPWDYGGPTLTCRPRPGSPVIDAGNPAGCTDHDDNLLTTDQRGYLRPIDADTAPGAVCDIGAVEFQYILTVTLQGIGSGVVTSSVGSINCGDTCSDEYGSGTAVTLTATADTGWVFAGWDGACSGTDATCKVTMDANKVALATFDAAHKVYLPLVLRNYVP
jgi:CSLREA domain-containing protein/uncharacterized repeat protein (TIGR02543 family)